jgi:hypothetical protein
MGTIADGYALKRIDGKNKIVKSKIHYQHDIEIIPSGFASPITESVAKVLINNYMKDSSSAQGNGPGRVFSLNDLSCIAKQEDCKEIAFYFAKRCINDFEDATGIDERMTLVAVGRNSKGFDIATIEKESIAKDIDGSQCIDDFSEDMKAEPTQNGIIMEMVPPIRLSTKKLIKLLREKSINEIMDYFEFK